MSPMARMLTPTEAGIATALELLRQGQCVAVPTETVYGLAAAALQESAVRQIFQIKGRPLLDPLIVHLSDLEHAPRYARVNDAARRLAAAFWPGPLTLVLPKLAIVPDLVTAGLPSVALRVPSHPVMQSLLRQLDFPLAAPSANPFGYVSPTTAHHVLESLGDRIAAVLDAGPCEHGLESTVVDLRDPHRPTLLRPGPISPEQLADVLGQSLARGATPSSAAQLSPGMLSRHYAPHTPIELAQQIDGEPRLGEAMVLLTRPRQVLSPHVYWLSEDGDLREAANRLFALLRVLDAGGYQRLRVQLAPESDLGVAINDRLRRAAAKR